MSTVQERPKLERDPLLHEPLTDLGNARRLVAVYGPRLRHVGSWRRWLAWDGRVWTEDTTGEVHRCAKSVARSLQLEALRFDPGDQRKAYRKAADRAESAAGIAAMLALAATEPEVAIRHEDLDADPWLLNVDNGILDLRDRRLIAHDPARLLTRITAATYDPDAPRATFDQFLARIQPDPTMRSFLGRLLGHALLGKVVEQVMPVLHGAGANGKSILVETILRALGDYGATGDPALLTDTGNPHPTGVADLFGRRLVAVHETDAGRRLAEGTVKRLTGETRVKARRMREDFWEFEASHTLLLVSNHRPGVRGTDEGIWRRLRLVPFDVVIPEGERDTGLGDRLQLELSGVLSWLVDGYTDWTQAGLSVPDHVRDATRAYRAESDHVGQWIEACCLTGPRYWASAGDLYQSWKSWARSEGAEELTQTAFGRRLADRGFIKSKSGTVRWTGIALATTDLDQEST
jgi:putative DNA primase/helicase